MGEVRDNISPLSGMVTFAVAFLAVYASTRSLLTAFVIALPLAVGVTFIVRGLFPANADLREYNLDSRRRVKKVFASVANIEKLARQVTDPQAQGSLVDGCKIIPQLIQQTKQQETTSFKVASTAANVQSYLTSIESVLGVYLRIQQNPSFFVDADRQLAAGKQGFADFDSFALKSIQQLNAGDTAGYAANLETLKPLTLPAMPTLTPPPVVKQ
ncbi:MAG TPA: hypothetical protein VH063_16665 [Gaiellaceae bacterium]|nr:hypothetical protein [Gaiellaceae bacterium]